MIKIQKKLSPNKKVRHLSSYKLVLNTFFFSLLVIILPLLLSTKSPYGYFRSLFIFYLAILLLAYILYRRYSQNKSLLLLTTRDLDEKSNSLTDEIQRLKCMKPALSQKISRYRGLENIVEELNKDLTLESVSNRLLDIIFDTIAQEKGITLLYLVDAKTHKLYLFATRKEDKDLVIKAKEGDIFDHWVLKHTSPLLVQDLRKDFRFDLQRLKLEHLRQLSSLISVPLLTQDKFLGILRLDSPRANIYTQEDLRFLNTISDLGAIALENARLFQRTLELATRDSLTSLYTRTYFKERLDEELKRNMSAGKSVSLLMIDIDHFKACNDKFGHIAGDIVLKRIGEIMLKFSKKYTGIASRFGGEEFTVILSDTEKQEARRRASELCSIIGDTKISLRRQEINITVSLGVACFPKDATGADDLVKKSDAALYQAKRSGRNKVCGF